MLVALGKNVKICLEWFQPKHHSLHPCQSSLEKPDKLVDVVPGDLLRLIQEEDSVVVTSLQGPEWPPILAGSYGEIRVAVWPEGGPLHQLVDDDEGRASWDRGGDWGQAEEEEDLKGKFFSSLHVIENI